MARIKLLVHSGGQRAAQTAARRSGARTSEMIWCQNPQGLRGLTVQHLAGMRTVHESPCESKLCDESMAHLRRIGVTI